MADLARICRPADRRGKAETITDQIETLYRALGRVNESAAELHEQAVAMKVWEAMDMSRSAWDIRLKTALDIHDTVQNTQEASTSSATQPTTSTEIAVKVVKKRSADTATKNNAMRCRVASRFGSDYWLTWGLQDEEKMKKENGRGLLELDKKLNFARDDLRWYLNLARSSYEPGHKRVEVEFRDINLKGWSDVTSWISSWEVQSAFPTLDALLPFLDSLVINRILYPPGTPYPPPPPTIASHQANIAAVAAIYGNDLGAANGAARGGAGGSGAAVAVGSNTGGSGAAGGGSGAATGSGAASGSGAGGSSVPTANNATPQVPNLSADLPTSNANLSTSNGNTSSQPTNANRSGSVNIHTQPTTTQNTSTPKDANRQIQSTSFANGSQTQTRPTSSQTHSQNASNSSGNNVTHPHPARTQTQRTSNSQNKNGSDANGNGNGNSNGNEIDPSAGGHRAAQAVSQTKKPTPNAAIPNAGGSSSSDPQPIPTPANTSQPTSSNQKSSQPANKSSSQPTHTRNGHPANKNGSNSTSQTQQPSSTRQKTPTRVKDSRWVAIGRADLPGYKNGSDGEGSDPANQAAAVNGNETASGSRLASNRLPTSSQTHQNQTQTSTRAVEDPAPIQAPQGNVRQKGFHFNSIAAQNAGPSTSIPVSTATNSILPTANTSSNPLPSSKPGPINLRPGFIPITLPRQSTTSNSFRRPTQSPRPQSQSASNVDVLSETQHGSQDKGKTRMERSTSEDSARSKSAEAQESASLEQARNQAKGKGKRRWNTSDDEMDRSGEDETDSDEPPSGKGKKRASASQSEQIELARKGKRRMSISEDELNGEDELDKSGDGDELEEDQNPDMTGFGMDLGQHQPSPNGMDISRAASPAWFQVGSGYGEDLVDMDIDLEQELIDPEEQLVETLVPEDAEETAVNAVAGPSRPRRDIETVNYKETNAHKATTTQTLSKKRSKNSKKASNGGNGASQTTNGLPEQRDETSESGEEEQPPRKANKKDATSSPQKSFATLPSPKTRRAPLRKITSPLPASPAKSPSKTAAPSPSPEPEIPATASAALNSFPESYGHLMDNRFELGPDGKVEPKRMLNIFYKTATGDKEATVILAEVSGFDHEVMPFRRWTGVSHTTVETGSVKVMAADDVTEHFAECAEDLLFGDLKAIQIKGYFEVDDNATVEEVYQSLGQSYDKVKSWKTSGPSDDAYGPLKRDTRNGNRQAHPSLPEPALREEPEYGYRKNMTARQAFQNFLSPRPLGVARSECESAKDLAIKDVKEGHPGQLRHEELVTLNCDGLFSYIVELADAEIPDAPDELAELRSKRAKINGQRCADYPPCVCPEEEKKQADKAEKKAKRAAKNRADDDGEGEETDADGTEESDSEEVNDEEPPEPIPYREIGKGKHRIGTLRSQLKNLKRIYDKLALWAVSNTPTTLTRPHVDSAGTISWLGQLIGRKLVLIGTESKQGPMLWDLLLLEPGDELILAPGTIHAVLTLSPSVTLGGHLWSAHGWCRTLEACLNEADVGSNECLPFRHVAMVATAWQAIQPNACDRLSLHQSELSELRGDLLQALSSTFFHYSTMAARAGDKEDGQVRDVADAWVLTEKAAAYILKRLREMEADDLAVVKEKFENQNVA